MKATALLALLLGHSVLATDSPDVRRTNYFRAETELLCASHPAARNPDTTVSRIALLIFPVRSDVSVSIFLFIAVLLAR